MICQHCRKSNPTGQNFCTFCGAAMTASEPYRPPTATKPPQPYSWASPSSPLHDAVAANLPQQVQPLESIADASKPETQVYPQPVLATYHCPHCGTTAQPILQSKIADGGWLVFVLMLIFCFPLFWIGFLIRERYSTCPACFKKLA